MALKLVGMIIIMFYYMEKVSLFGNRSRRWVIYDEEVEASMIPPAWHLWLHYTSDKIPENNKFVTPRWLKEAQANKSGSRKAYHPSKYQDQIMPDYEPWRPTVNQQDHNK